MDSAFSTAHIVPGMPTQIESARFANISALDKASVGRKLRVAGRYVKEAT
jgi:hypothetical protein